MIGNQTLKMASTSHSNFLLEGSNGDDRLKKRKSNDTHLEGESKMTKRQPIGDVTNVAGNLMTQHVMGKSNAAIESHNLTSREEHMEDQSMDQLEHQEPLFLDDTYGLAENMLEFSLQRPGKGQSKEMGRKQSDEILKRLSALSNSGGGVLKVENHYGLSPDDWLMPVQQRLCGVLDPESLASVCDTTWRPTSTYIFVRKMSTMCTISTECYEFSDTQVTRLSAGKVQRLLAEQAVSRRVDHYIEEGLECLPPLPKMIYGERPGNLRNETIREQFKNGSCDLFLTDLAKNVSGFANTSGGHLFWGIQEQKVVDMKIPIVRGRCCDDLDNINSKIKEKIAKMLWGFKPVIGKHWNVQHILVPGKRQCNKSTCNGDRYVVIISVAKIRGSGGVYSRIPESYELRDNQPVKMDFDLWKKVMYAGSEYRKSNAYDELITQRMKLLSMSLCAGKSTSVYSVKDSVEEIADSLFQAKTFDESTVWPESFYRICLTDRQRHKVNEILQRLALNEYQGTAVCVKSVLDVAIKNQTSGAGIYKPKSLICDLLLCVKDLGLFLLTVSDVNDDAIKQYNLETGKQLKQALAVIGGCTEKMAINCRILNVSSPSPLEVQLKQDGRYPDDYRNLTDEKYLSVMRALTIVLSAVPSVLSQKVGCTLLNTLTPKQFYLLLDSYHKHCKLWVRGPPGTGKTVVAFELMRKLQRDEDLKPEEILYVTEFSGNLHKAENTGCCVAVLRKNFSRKCNKYKHVKHIILDGVQNFCNESGFTYEKWYPKALAIQERSGGYCWMFIDCAQKLSKLTAKQSGIPYKRQLEPLETLSRVIRNSVSIFKYAEPHLKDEYKHCGIQPAHDFKGGEPQELRYTDSQLVSCICYIVKCLIYEGFSPCDIAVLAKTLPDCDIPGLKEALARIDVPVGDVDQEHMDNCLVLTSVRLFSELERPVVIGVDPDINTDHTVKKGVPFANYNAFMLTLCTRAMTKLIILKRSIIDQDNWEAKYRLRKRMKLDFTVM
ncbi:schlafen family member 13-like [Ptychodera flava]|uniref:schlafen family member 13-like n=1 Tax=Ptychodera flava TaxID=63121 RepID=UPI00396A20D7